MAASVTHVASAWSSGGDGSARCAGRPSARRDTAPLRALATVHVSMCPRVNPHVHVSILMSTCHPRPRSRPRVTSASITSTCHPRPRSRPRVTSASITSTCHPSLDHVHVSQVVHLSLDHGVDKSAPQHHTGLVCVIDNASFRRSYSQMRAYTWRMRAYSAPHRILRSRCLRRTTKAATIFSRERRRRNVFRSDDGRATLADSCTTISPDSGRVVIAVRTAAVTCRLTLESCRLRVATDSSAKVN